MDENSSVDDSMDLMVDELEALRRSRRAAGGTYTVSGRFEVYDDMQVAPQAQTHSKLYVTQSTLRVGLSGTSLVHCAS